MGNLPPDWLPYNLRSSTWHACHLCRRRVLVFSVTRSLPRRQTLLSDAFGTSTPLLRPLILMRRFVSVVERRGKWVHVFHVGTRWQTTRPYNSAQFYPTAVYARQRAERGAYIVSPALSPPQTSERSVHHYRLARNNDAARRRRRISTSATMWMNCARAHLTPI